MMITRLTISIIVFAILSSIIIADDPCVFRNEKGVIDITSLGLTTGQPKYADRIPPTGSNYKYSYNPCKPFSEGRDCQGVAACQVSMDGLYQFAIGSHDTAVWSAGGGIGGNPSVMYTSGIRKSQIMFECLRTGGEEFEALGEEPSQPGFFKFRLAHLCACWDGCKSGPTPPPSPSPTTKSSGDDGNKGVSGGTVFIILLPVVLVAYFVGFALFYRIRQEKSGTELIAHRTFWAALPGCAKDGVVYVYQRVANKGAGSY